MRKEKENQKEKTLVLSNTWKVKQNKEGNRIFLYRLIVTTISLPFIFVFIFKSSAWGGKPLAGFTISFLVWLDAFSFPLFLQKGQLLNWLIITGLLLFPVPFFLFHRKKQVERIEMKAVEEEFPEEETSDQLKPEEYPQEYIEEQIEEQTEEYIEEQTEEYIEEQIEDQTEELIEELIEEYTEDLKGEYMPEAVTCNQVVSTIEDSALSFEELLELGFSAKELGEHQKAAEYFVLALKTRPAPDICYYLIMDSYWLWKSANLAELAIHELKPFIKNCLTEAPEDWQKRLREWLQENQIQLK